MSVSLDPVVVPRTRHAAGLIIRGVAALALLFCLPAAALGSDSHAKRLTADNVSELRVGGTDAIGGIGDWAFGNGTLCAVVSDPSHESILSPYGGVLIDLGHCGRHDDQWNVLQPLVNFSREQIPPITDVRAEGPEPDGTVRIVTRGGRDGLSFESRYTLSPRRPTVLEIDTTVRRLPDPAGDGERAFMIGDVAIHGGRQLAPFTLSLAGASHAVRATGSVGFHHPRVDVDDTLAMIGALVPANLHVLVADDSLDANIAYGLYLVGAWREDTQGGRTPLPFVAINGDTFSLLGAFVQPFWVGGNGSIGLLELAQTIFMDVEPGEAIVFARELIVGDRSDVASVTDQLWPDAALLRGTVEPGARIHVSDQDGTPITEVRPEASGTFAFRLPPGRYTLRVPAPAGRQIERDVEMRKADVDLGTLLLPAAATVALPRGRPMRLVFLRADGEPPPQLRDDLLDFRVGEEHFAGSGVANHVSLAGIDLDPEQILLAPGPYRVYATRGPDFTVTVANLTAIADRVTALQIETPVRLLSHPGWLAADLHVHAANSDDSSFPMLRRVSAFVAAGADVIVATEHDAVADYGPLIARLGLDHEIISMVGVEVTSVAQVPPAPYTFGHANAYPIAHRPLAYRGGAPRSEGRRLRALVADIRALGGERIVQLNHPRSKSGRVESGNFFTHLSVAGEPFRPALALSAAPNDALIERDPESGWRDLDFDVVELMNGASMRPYSQIRADWYSLLLQGEYRPGVANSDSHTRAELVALPRTLVRLPIATADAGATPGDARAFDEAAFVQALRAGRAYGTTGPLLEVALHAHGEPPVGIGDLFTGQSATLEVTVHAAPWVPVSRIQIFVNGALAHDGPIAAEAPLSVPLSFDRDAFVTLEVSGDPGGTYAVVAPGFVPFAFTNPIFVDANGDGHYRAPGLPREPLPILFAEPR